MYDDLPKAMRKYLMHNGWHFNKSLCEFAVSLMKKNGKRLDPISKENVDKLLEQYKIQLENNVGYDYVFVANMCKFDFYGSSIEDEAHLAKYVKDVIDDPDAYDGMPFSRWYTDMCRKGMPIDWEMMI